MLVEEILSLICESENTVLIGSTLKDIGCFLSRGQLCDAMVIVNRLRESDRLSVLGNIATFLDQELAMKALDQVRECMPDSIFRTQAILDLLPRIPLNLHDKVIEEAAEKTVQVSDALVYEIHVEDLWTVADHISTKLLRRLVAGARERQIANVVLIHGYRVLAERLPLNEVIPLRSEVAALVHTVDSPQTRKKLMEDLGMFDEIQSVRWLIEVLTSETKRETNHSEMNTSQLISEISALPMAAQLGVWNDCLRCLDTITREKMFESLRELLPLLQNFGAYDWAEQALKTIEDVAHWWR